MNMLSRNIANADTPNYKAKDIDFRAELARATDDQMSNFGTSRTNARHFDLSMGGVGAPEEMYRMPESLSLNGNTVEPHKEHAEFMDNALRYQASLNLLDSRIKGLRAAIKGE